MAKIYISSTYNDLKEFRRKVYETLRKMGHDAIAMEDYVASDKRAVEKCLSDVAACEIYIGIFAWRYGYMPTVNNPDKLSITEMEYREAGKLRKEKLLFLLDDQIPWMPSYIDSITGDGDQGIRIKELRNWLKSNTTVSFFKNDDELASLVSAAVYNSTTIKSGTVKEIVSSKSILSEHQQPFDHAICEYASLADLDIEKINAFIRLESTQRQSDYLLSGPLQNQLTSLGLLKNGNPTFGAILCFGQNPQMHLAGALTRCIHWNGLTRQNGWRNDSEYRGNLLNQLELALDFLRKSLRFSRVIGREGRAEQCEIPFAALEEAVANAIIHREYANRHEAVQIEIFDNRIEIKNPGLLPLPLTIEMLGKDDVSHPRNPLVARIFYLHGYVEKAGSGIMRIHQLLDDALLPRPEYQINNPNTLRITIYRPDDVPDQLIFTRGFGELISQGIESTALLKNSDKESVVEELSQSLGLKTSIHIYRWQKGYIPSDQENVADLARFFVKVGNMDQLWAKSILELAQYTNIDAVIDELFNKIKHNLPQRYFSVFVGRTQEIKKVMNLLKPYPHSPHYFVSIDGMGGIGKSALALEIAHFYEEHYNEIPKEDRFDAIVWCSAKKDWFTTDGKVPRSSINTTLSDIYQTIAIVLELPSIVRESIQNQTDLIRQALKRERVLLMIDNLDTVEDETIFSFLAELPAPTKAIVTTRKRSDLAYPLRLQGLSHEEGTQLIEYETQKRNIQLGDDNAYKLYLHTGGVPLAIIWSVSQISRGYDTDSVLSKLSRADSDIASYLFKEIIETIRNTATHKVLMVLSLVDEGTDRNEIMHIANLDQMTCDDSLVYLLKLSLINQAENKFHLLPLTKAFMLNENKNYPEIEKEIRGRMSAKSD